MEFGTQLESFSESSIKELIALRKENPQWSKTFSKNLHKWLKEASPADWRKLESQDPFGGLKRLFFEKLVSAIS